MSEDGFTQVLTEEDINNPLYDEYMDYWGDTAGNDCIPISFSDWKEEYYTLHPTEL